MRGCEADRCDAGATVDGRWCERHAPGPVTEAYTQAHEHAERTFLARADALREASGYAIEAPSNVAQAWAKAEQMVDEAEWELKRARNGRLAVLIAMRESGWSLGDIAKVTGLTRQRIGQLLKDMP